MRDLADNGHLCAKWNTSPPPPFSRCTCCSASVSSSPDELFLFASAWFSSYIIGGSGRRATLARSVGAFHVDVVMLVVCVFYIFFLFLIKFQSGSGAGSQSRQAVADDEAGDVGLLLHPSGSSQTLQRLLNISPPPPPAPGCQWWGLAELPGAKLTR